MSTGLPEWATEPPFDPARGWLPIVCTGGRGALSHPLELIGLYFDAEGWRYRGRPDERDNAQLAHIFPTARDRVFVYDDDGNVVGTRSEGRGSVRVDCSVCTAVHRVTHEDWGRFLEAARVSGAPFADTSALE